VIVVGIDSVKKGITAPWSMKKYLALQGLTVQSQGYSQKTVQDCVLLAITVQTVLRAVLKSHAGEVMYFVPRGVLNQRQ
jgi:hypothetical protein